MPFIEYLKLIQHLKGFTAIEKTILVLLLLAGVGGVLVLGSAFTVWQILVAVLCILALAWYLFSIRRSKLSRGRRRLVFGLLSLMTVAYVIAAGLAPHCAELHLDATIRED